MVDAVKIAKGRQAEIAAENRRLMDFLVMAEKLVKDGRLEGSNARPQEGEDGEESELAPASAHNGGGEPRRELFSRKMSREGTASGAAEKSASDDTLFLRA